MIKIQGISSLSESKKSNKDLKIHFKLVTTCLIGVCTHSYESYLLQSYYSSHNMNIDCNVWCIFLGGKFSLKIRYK